jgi:hypothetical protein
MQGVLDLCNEKHEIYAGRVKASGLLRLLA